MRVPSDERGEGFDSQGQSLSLGQSREEIIGTSAQEKATYHPSASWRS